MALKEYVGAIALEIDGRDFEAVDFSVKYDTGRKLVKTMNRQGKALGFCQGVRLWEITLTVVIPVDEDDISWDEVEGAKITVYPVKSEGKRTSYLDCFVVDASEKYEAENEARMDLTVMALDKITE